MMSLFIKTRGIYVCSHYCHYGEDEPRHCDGEAAIPVSCMDEVSVENVESLKVSFTENVQVHCSRADITNVLLACV